MLKLFVAFFLMQHPSDSLQHRTVTIKEISFEGNKKTKSYILSRELVFHAGDTVNLVDLNAKTERSRQNLMNTELFTFVYSSIERPDSNTVKIHYTFKEGWYTWPAPIFELVDRNFNEWYRTKDLSRTNIGLYVTQYNVRGRNETFNVGLRAGYTESYDLQYTFPWINKKQTLGLTAAFSSSRNHETVYNTNKNRLVFFKDDQGFTRNNQSTSIRLSYRKGLYESHFFKLGYTHFQVVDEILKLNPLYFPISGNVAEYLFFSYLYKVDYKDYKPYPLVGRYLDFEVQKVGLGLFNKGINELFLSLNVKRYWHLKGLFYYAAGFTEKVGFVEKQSYYNQESIGYADYPRGYEYYVINGQNYHLLQTNLKYNLLPTKVIRLKYIPLEKFRTIPNALFVNLFTDMGYVKDNYFYTRNPLANKFLLGYGIGVDYVTYYSSTLQFDYSFNLLGESGFFLHFTIAI